MTPTQAIAQLQQIAANSKEAMKRAEITIANEIALTAVQLAPEDSAGLVNSIEVKQGSERTSVVVEAPYAAYVEFGTGSYAAEYVASLPTEWQDEARKFFINGLGKGQAHPFFYPSVQQHTPELIPELEKELEKISQ